MNQIGEALGRDVASPSFKVKRHVLVVVPKASTATQMIYELPFRQLSGGTFPWRIVLEYYLKAEDLEDIQILILYRCVQGTTLSLIRLASARGIKVIYEMDDDLLEPPEDESWGKRYRIGHVREIIKMFLAEADLVKAGSPELARRLNQRGYRAIYRPYTAKICDIPKVADEPPFRVGYFGTPHHRKDIEKVYPALLAMKEVFQEQVEFEFIGCYPQDWRKLKARVLSYEPDYEIFIKLLAKRGWSLGLAPLRRTMFNEAKSNSKFRDFTAAGVLGIYEDLAPYRDTVINGENGWLAGDEPDEWLKMIKRAFSCAERPEMLNLARNAFDENYHPKIVARKWIEMIKEIID